VVWRSLTEAHLGEYEHARRDLEDAVRRFSGFHESHLMRAWFLASCPSRAYRDGPTALTEAHFAVDLSFEGPYALDVVAIAYAEVGDFDAARKWELQALAKLPKSAPEREALEARLETFQHNRPYRDYPLSTPGGN
jgi:tetratricopeptide (TPR) repeat protein